MQISNCSKSEVHRFDEVNNIQLVDKLHQAGKIHNLYQVCGVFGCVYGSMGLCLQFSSIMV